ncbi:hypothetical protein EYF80_022498 [Liparis tanakae]|uniref:Uncharacterized protein n=1 Tax=Liparis tanakae TaxID=230148 RepID=A0A4Z2HN04_9TELE|nr:hypothetical protein EYF80_022498 [Liparis tanakae]
MNICASGRPLLRPSANTGEPSSPPIGRLGLLPVCEVRWARTLSGEGVPTAASDTATGRGSRRSSSTPPPPSASASPGCCPGCGSLDGPPAPLLQGDNTLAGVTRGLKAVLMQFVLTQQGRSSSGSSSVVPDVVGWKSRSSASLSMITHSLLSKSSSSASGTERMKALLCASWSTDATDASCRPLA